VAETQTLVDGLAFPEGPRWREGWLWFADMHDQRVKRVDLDGRLETVCEVEGSPSGLGWDPDGQLLIVSMVDRRLLRWSAGTLHEVSDLSGFSPHRFNDLVVDAEGRAYVGNFGCDFFGGEPARPTVIVRVDIDGRATVAAEDVLFPNGMVITPDGGTLVVGESYGGRLTAFRIATDGSLEERRVFAEGGDLVPDGICLDAEGAIWSANPLTHEVVRVREGGEVVDRVSTGERGAYACMLGGPDGRTLFVCAAEVHDPGEARRRRTGSIEIARVAVPHAGLP
jgi:sugar lactone lactonase YvrE